MNSSIPPLNLTPLPLAQPAKKASPAAQAAEISFDNGAVNNAKILLDDNAKIRLDDSDNLQLTLIKKLVEAPPSRSFASQEGKVAADIINHLLPSFVDSPDRFVNDLLHNINKKEAPAFLNYSSGVHSMFGADSWKALLQDKPALKNVFTAIDQALTGLNEGDPNPPLLKPLIDKIGDDKSSATTSGVASKATNPKKLLALAGLSFVSGFGIYLDLTGTIDWIPGVGPSKGGTPPPQAQVVTNDVMKKINSFPGKDISRESQSTIQDRIDTNLNKLPSTFSMRPTAYVEDTKKSVSASGKVVGVEVEAQVGTNPIKIVYQESTSGTQITIMPEQNKGGDSMIIKVPAGGKPTVEEHKQVAN